MESFIITFLFKVQLYYQSKCSVLKKILKKKHTIFFFSNFVKQAEHD